jgi:hypothetical protein
MSADPRSRAQRCRDTEHRLTHEIDVWVASASADGAPYLVPLSFDWEDEALLAATPTDSPTARTGFDPRALAMPYRWFRNSSDACGAESSSKFPRRIQAWREVNEMPDRELMRDGRWLV